jgi:two-component system, NarL family, response regulator LiaR
MSTIMERIKVLIVDDHQVVRQGLRTFLELQEDIQVIGEANDGGMALEMTDRLSPDVVLMDLVMPGMDGIAATRRIKALGTGVKVIALTSFTEDDKVFPAIQAGASSYLLKDVTPDVLVEAIRAAHRGEARLHPDIVRKLMEQVARQAPTGQADPVAGLTQRERQVIRLVAQGKNNREIAETLVISEKTAKTHVSNILGKLGLEDRTQMAIHAIRNGLVDQDKAHPVQSKHPRTPAHLPGAGIPVPAPVQPGPVEASPPAALAAALFLYAVHACIGPDLIAPEV